LRSRLIRSAFVVAIALGVLTAGLWHSRLNAQTPTPRPTEAYALVAGCNNVAVTWPSGTPLTMVSGAITPPTALESIWRLDNAQQKYYGFSPLPSAAADMANDYNTVLVILEPVYVCMREAGTFNRPDLR
jgi:hypothetical protein